MPAAPIPSSSSQFGPGSWTPADFRESSAGFGRFTPGLMLTLTTNQELIIDQALRDTMDFFLMNDQQPSRELQLKALREYLKGNLPVPAYVQAEQLLQQYVSYMDAHDHMLTGQAFPDLGQALSEADIQRLLVWQEQRARLRQSLLGMQVTQAWYEDEDLQFKQTLDYLRNAAALGKTARLARGMQGALKNFGKSYRSLAQDPVRHDNGS
ncbi:hypothetical protein [Undibacterium sp. RuTC16W]|uniref:hypothetical protein n=1 Tax=Undibacterium sp. RuTC16W TaxID=3413048 RepID=UPI003BEF82EA